jgi:hypothetical protein
MTHQPSAAAPSLPSPSSSLSSAATTALSSIAYELRDDSNLDVVLASDSLPRGTIVSIADLRRAVFAANAIKLRGCDPTDLDIYPPGSTDWTDRSAAAKPRSTVASLLPQAAGADDTFVVIARPLPSFGGAPGQSLLSPQQSCLLLYAFVPSPAHCCYS